MTKDEKRISVSEEIFQQLLNVVGTHPLNDVAELWFSAKQDARLIEEKVKENDDK